MEVYSSVGFAWPDEDSRYGATLTLDLPNPDRRRMRFDFWGASATSDRGQIDASAYFRIKENEIEKPIEFMQGTTYGWIGYRESYAGPVQLSWSRTDSSQTAVQVSAMAAPGEFKRTLGRIFTVRSTGDKQLLLTDITVRTPKIAFVVTSDGRTSVLPFVSLLLYDRRGRQIASDFEMIKGIEGKALVADASPQMDLTVNTQRGQEFVLEAWALPEE